VSSPQTLCESPGFSGPILFAMNQTQDLICYSFCNTYTGTAIEQIRSLQDDMAGPATRGKWVYNQQVQKHSSRTNS